MASVNKFDFSTLLGKLYIQLQKFLTGKLIQEICPLEKVINQKTDEFDVIIFCILLTSIDETSGLGQELHDVEFIILEEGGKITGER